MTTISLAVLPALLVEPALAPFMNAALGAGSNAGSVSAPGRDEIELPSGYLAARPVTRESILEDQAIYSMWVERRYLTWKNIHKSKQRIYQNLERKERRSYRRFTGSLVHALWCRGAMNDLYRIVQLVCEYQRWTRPFMRDMNASTARPERLVLTGDPETSLELQVLFDTVKSTIPGFRLIPLSNIETFTTYSIEALRAFSGLGALTVSYPMEDADIVKRRLQRHFRLGEFRDEDIWRKKEEAYQEDVAHTSAFVKYLGEAAKEYGKRTIGIIEDLPSNSLFVMKQRMFERCFITPDLMNPVEMALDLIVKAERLQSAFGKAGRGCNRPERNQMAGLCMRIGSLAVSFVDNPTVGGLLAIGTVGVIGTPLIIDCNRDGIPNLYDADYLPDTGASSTGAVEFDLDADGFRETIEWFQPGCDALLALDRNGNGRIDDGTELFGAVDGFTDGFARLSGLDANGDGVVSGREMDGLLLWFDDGDGRSCPGELVPAREWGLMCISVGHDGFMQGSCTDCHGVPVKMWDWYTEVVHAEHDSNVSTR